MPRSKHEMAQTIPRPIPSEAAKRGLQRVKAVTVEFSGGSAADQQAALEHFDELVAFWNLKARAWIPVRGRR